MPLGFWPGAPSSMGSLFASSTRRSINSFCSRWRSSAFSAISGLSIASVRSLSLACSSRIFSKDFFTSANADSSGFFNALASSCIPSKAFFCSLTAEAMSLSRMSFPAFRIERSAGFSDMTSSARVNFSCSVAVTESLADCRSISRRLSVRAAILSCSAASSSKRRASGCFPSAISCPSLVLFSIASSKLRIICSTSLSN